MHHIWSDDAHITAADKEWLEKRKYYIENQDDKVPAQGKFNAGQKIYYWAMFFGAIPVVALRIVHVVSRIYPLGSQAVHDFHP